MSMSPFIRDLAAKLDGMTGMRSARGCRWRTGSTREAVTVSGLITGGDIIAALAGAEPHDETNRTDSHCLNDDGFSSTVSISVYVS